MKVLQVEIDHFLPGRRRWIRLKYHGHTVVWIFPGFASQFMKSIQHISSGLDRLELTPLTTPGPTRILD